jgi:hypothetical protein
MKHVLLLGTCLFVVAMGCGTINDPTVPRDTVTRWVLSKKGRLVVSGRIGEITSPQQVPTTSYNIEKINLNEAPLTDDDLKILRELTNLKSLSLYRTNIGDKGIEHLLGLQSLEELELSYTQITDKGVKSLAQLKNLRKLFLRGTSQRVTSGSLKVLHEELPNCEIFR